MTVTLKVAPDKLRTTSHVVSGLAQQLQTEFSAMQEAVSRTSYYWTGAAGDQYRKNFAARKEETSQILAYIKQYPNDLMTMANVYEETENENIELSNALSSNFIT